MKKTLVLSLFGCAACASSYAQGVFFSNYQTSTQTQGVTFAAGSGALSGLGVGSSFSAILLYGPAGLNSVASLAPIGNPSSIATSLGYSPTAAGAIGGGSGAGWFGNPIINFPSYSTTYTVVEEVTGIVAGVTYTGYSSIIQYTTAASSAVPTAKLPNFLALGNFTVASSVPEPATLALAGLGGLASLVMLRRKKA
jgi:hypothetical protein